MALDIMRGRGTPRRCKAYFPECSNCNLCNRGDPPPCVIVQLSFSPPLLRNTFYDCSPRTAVRAHAAEMQMLKLQLKHRRTHETASTPVPDRLKTLLCIITLVSGIFYAFALGLGHACDSSFRCRGAWVGEVVRHWGVGVGGVRLRLRGRETTNCETGTRRWMLDASFTVLKRFKKRGKTRKHAGR